MTDSPFIDAPFPSVLVTAWGGRVLPSGDSYNRLVLNCPHPDRYRQGDICWRCSSAVVWKRAEVGA